MPPRRGYKKRARTHAREGWFRFHLLIFRPRYVRLRNWSIRLGTSVRSRRFPPHSCAPCPAVDFAGGFNSLPRVWRRDAAGNLSLATFREVLPHFDSANRLIEHFFDAALPVPNLFREILVGGGERSPLYAWIVETMRSVWPQLVEMGIATGRGDSGRDT